MVSISIHNPTVKELAQWTRNNGEVYYVVRVVEKNHDKELIDIFVDDIDEFIAQLVAQREANLTLEKCREY